MEKIKNNYLSEKETKMIREKFKHSYAKSKGWNPNDLTTEQLIEITQQKEWRNPGLLFS
jgi:hypothetical protein